MGDISYTKTKNSNGVEKTTLAYLSSIPNVKQPDTIFGGKSLTCFISGEVNLDMVGAFADIIRSIEANPCYSLVDQVVIEFSSAGGGIYSAFEILNMVDRFNVDATAKICMYGTGLIASAGLIVFLSGYGRACGRSVTFLIHQLSSSVWGKLFEIETEVVYLGRLQEIVSKEIMDRTNIKKRTLNKVKKDDFYFDAWEAQDLGVVGKVF